MSARQRLLLALAVSAALILAARVAAAAQSATSEASTNPAAATPAGTSSTTAAATPAATPATTVVTRPPVPRAWGRVSFYTNVASLAPDGAAATTSGQYITSVNYQLPDGDGDGLEYAVDFRQASSTGLSSQSRLSIYDGYVGQRFAGGRARVRAGQMWLTDLGGLGSVAGALFEFRQAITTSAIGRWRIGGFGGVEPQPYTLGYVPGVKKFGGYAALEGDHGRHTSVGFVRLMNSGLTERAVITTTTFLPAKSKVFLYQSAEYDLVGPAGQGSGGLSYLFANVRAAVSAKVELQGIYHRGRSIDTRTITEDVLNGRPLQIGALDAFLYQSAGGRVSVRLSREIRLNGGYTVDRNSRDAASTGRATFGFYASNIAKTGLDTTVNVSRINRPTGQYNALYASVGRQFGRRLYFSGDYSSSLSVARFTRSDGVTVELRPQTRQITFSSVVNMSRRVSLLATCERTRDDSSSELRVLAGLSYRFR